MPKTKPAQASSSLDLLIAQCLYCRKELKIPKKFDKRLGSSSGSYKRRLTGQHPGFYVSQGFSYYCDQSCFTMFTED